MSLSNMNRLGAICLARLIAALIFALFSYIPVVGASLGDRGASTPTIEWALDAWLTAPNSRIEEIGSPSAKAAEIDVLLVKLKAEGAKAEARGPFAHGPDHGVSYALKASGKHDVQAFRKLLHTVAKPQLNLLGGMTEMEIENSGVEADDMILVLDSNLSTGYGWHVSPESAMVGSAPHQYEKHTVGYGVPERQTIRLTRGNAGAGPIKLAYKRAWENDSVSGTQLKLKLSTMPSKLDLSDPNASTAPLSMPQGVVHGKAFPKAEAALPTQFDWRGQGIVPAVRDQGGCGSCWAFGTVGVMECAMLMNGATDSDLSEQFLVSCNKDGWNCGGGWTAHKYHFDTEGKMQTTVGAVLESVKPYTASNGTCTTNYVKPYILSGWEFVIGSEWEVPTDEQIKSAIYTYGPVTAGICAGSGWYTYPGNGDIYTTDDTDYCGGSTNHQIVLVGWNDTEGYWILRNSWGAGWGLSGYMHIKYGVSRVGEGTSWVATGKFLTVTKTGGGTGTVTSSPSGINCGGVCSYGFSSGAVVTLTATASIGSAFTGWSGACSGMERTCTVRMDAGVSANAAFSSYPLTVTKTGSGTGAVTSSPQGISCGSTCSHEFSSGAVVTLTATADAGSVFTGWSGDTCNGITNTSCALTMDAGKSISASFKLVCSYSATPATISFGYKGGYKNVTISAVNAGRVSCPKPDIMPGPDADWLTADKLVFGTRNKGSVRLKASAYTTSLSDRPPGTVTITRPATLVGGTDGILTVNQKGKPCALGSLTPSHFSFDSAVHTGGTFTVTATPSDCEWTVTMDPSCKDCSWIDIASASSGSGDGIVAYNVAAVPTGGKSRTGKFIVTLKQKPSVKRAFTVRQSNRP